MDNAGVVQGQESAFPKAEYEARQAGARARLVAAGLDAMVVAMGHGCV